MALKDFETRECWNLPYSAPRSVTTNTVVEEAAALMESLANNHAFHDGNKRIALIAADTFLEMNGFRMKVQAREGYTFITQSLAKGEFRFAEILKWIEGHIVKA